MRVGYGPWGPEWRTWLSSPSPWWFLPLLRPLEAVAGWLEHHRFERLHTAVWTCRGWVWEAARRWRFRRRCSALWWEYHAT